MAVRKHPGIKMPGYFQSFLWNRLLQLINKNEDGSVLRRLHHILKLLIRRVGRFELGLVAVRKDSGADSRNGRAALLRSPN